MIKKFFTLLCLCTLCIGSAWGATGTFTLVTDASTLKAGDIIVLGCSSKSKAAGAMGSNDYFNSVDATISDGVLTSSEAIEITLGASAGAWTLTTTEGQITANKAKSLVIKTGSQKTCTISITNSNAKITFSTFGDIQYNSSNPRFLNYTSSQTAIQIYKKATKALTSIAVKTAPTKVEYTEGEKFDPIGLVITATYSDASTQEIAYSENESDFTFAPSLTTALLESNTSVTITYGGKTCTQDITVNAAPHYTVTIIEPENGTLSVKNGETVVNSGDGFISGTVLTIEATPATGYKFRNWQADDGTTHTYTKTFNYTIDKKDVTIQANFEALPTYTINYMVNGVNTNPQENVYEGTALVFPTVNDFGGKVFVGWSKTEIAEATDEKPALVETTDLTATATITYYAVFATKRVGEEKSEELTNNTIKSFEQLAYTTEKSYEGTELKYSIYGYTDAKNRPWIQLKKDKEVYVKITAPSNIKKVDVKITSASNSSGGINDISKHTAFSGTVGLVTTDCSFSTSSENVGSTEEVEDYIATISVSGEAEELYLKVSTGARIWGITTHYGTPDSYSAYCTSVAPRTQDVTIASSGYSSFSSTYTVTIPDGITAYYATGVKGNKVSMTEVEGGVIPANEGVIIKGKASQKYTFTETISDKSFYNKLIAVSERIEGLAPEVTIENVVYKNYVFTGGQFHPFTSGATVSVGAGKAYLQVEKPNLDGKLEMSFGDVTGITSYENDNENFKAMTEGKGVYNINGMRVNNSYKGIVIINGKKYMNK